MIHTAPERMTILIDDETAQSIKRLEGVTGLKGFAQVLDLGVTLLDWVVEQQKNGFEFGRLNEDATFDQLVIGSGTPV